MNSTENETQSESRKSIKDIQKVFQNPLKKGESGEVENPTNQNVRKSIKGDNAWIKRKPETEEEPEVKPVEEKPKKKIMEPVVVNVENVVKEEIDAKANIKKFEEIARRNSEKQKVIREIEEKKQKRIENIENKMPNTSEVTKTTPVKIPVPVRKEDFIVETLEKVKVQDVVAKIETNNSVVLKADPSKEEEYENVLTEDSNEDDNESVGNILENEKIKIEDDKGHQEIKTEIIESTQDPIYNQQPEIITDSKGTSNPDSEFEQIKGTDSAENASPKESLQANNLDNNQLRPELKPSIEIKEVDPQEESQAQPQLEPQLEPLVEPQVEPQVDTQVELQAEAQVEPQVEPPVEPHIENAANQEEIQTEKIPKENIAVEIPQESEQLEEKVIEEENREIEETPKKVEHEPQGEIKIEAEPEQIVDNPVVQKLETKFEEIVEPKKEEYVEIKVESAHKQQPEPKVELQVEQKVEAKAEVKYERRPEPQVEIKPTPLPEPQVTLKYGQAYIRDSNPSPLGDLAEYRDLHVGPHFDNQDDDKDEKVQNISILPFDLNNRSDMYFDRDDVKLSIQTTPLKNKNFELEDQGEVVKRSPLGRNPIRVRNPDLGEFSFDEKIDTQSSLIVSKIEEKQNLLLGDAMVTDRSVTSQMNTARKISKGFCEYVREIVSKCINSRKK